MKRIRKTLFATCALALWLAVPQARAGVAFTNLVFFTYTNAPNYGWNNIIYLGHTSALVEGNDGSFYGTTVAGGTVYESNSSPPTYGFGTLFKVSPAGGFTSLHSFGSVDGDGRGPEGNLTKGLDGNIYGTTDGGGSLPFVGQGTIFKVSTGGTLTTLYSFGHDMAGDPDLNNVYTNSDGGTPIAGIIQGRDGNFYGTTKGGGARDGGTVFQFKPDGTLITLFTFPYYSDASYVTNGNGPLSELAEGDDGAFYGTTFWGGANGAGTIFRITSGGTLTTLASFEARDGYPNAPLVNGGAGVFYGLTQNSVFKVTADGRLTILHSFGGGDGLSPSALILGSDGKLYGTTSGGGAHWPGTTGGTVFQMTTNGVFNSLYSFGGPDGSEPQSALVQAKDGSFYGTTSYGGPQWIASGGTQEPFPGFGTIFRIAIPPSLQSITQTNGIVNLTLSVMPGQTYQLEYSTNLTSLGWLSLGSPTIASSPTVSATDDIGSDPQRYYRVALVSP